MESSTIELSSQIRSGKEILIVDGMLSGTGVRLRHAGGFVKLAELALSAELVTKINTWKRDYENHHFFDFADDKETERLDIIGLRIMQDLKNETGAKEVLYYSNAKLEYQR